MDNQYDNVKNAVINMELWLKWEPNDITGAISFAGDQLETVDEVDKFENIIREIYEIANE